MGEHTPGPWFPNRVEASGDWTVRHGSSPRKGGTMMAVARLRLRDRRLDVSGPDLVAAIEADACLIAAAPDLLGTLEWIAATADYAWTPELKAQVEAVLAKAKGSGNASGVS